MRRSLQRILLSFLFVSLSLSASLAAEAPITGKVMRVYDGDTIRVEKVGKVRLLGIDTPEWEASDRDRYYLRKGISASTLRRIAATAREYMSNEIYGQQVTLVMDHDERDRHGRLLAYVYLSDGRLINRELLERGLAAVYRKYNFRLKSDFIRAEKGARNMSRGIWANPKGRNE